MVLRTRLGNKGTVRSTKENATGKNSFGKPTSTYKIDGKYCLVLRVVCTERCSKIASGMICFISWIVSTQITCFLFLSSDNVSTLVDESFAYRCRQSMMRLRKLVMYRNCIVSHSMKDRWCVFFFFLSCCGELSKMVRSKNSRKWNGRFECTM